MSIKPLIPPVEALVQDELAIASVKFGERHHSPHEAYAVMLEELEEAKNEISWIDSFIKGYWAMAKANIIDDTRTTIECVGNMKKHAIDAACELIQFAAMCEKTLKGYETEARP